MKILKRIGVVFLVIIVLFAIYCGYVYYKYTRPYNAEILKHKPGLYNKINLRHETGFCGRNLMNNKYEEAKEKVDKCIEDNKESVDLFREATKQKSDGYLFVSGIIIGGLPSSMPISHTPVLFDILALNIKKDLMSGNYQQAQDDMLVIFKGLNHLFQERSYSSTSFIFSYVSIRELYPIFIQNLNDIRFNRKLYEDLLVVLKDIKIKKVSEKDMTKDYSEGTAFVLGYDIREAKGLKVITNTIGTAILDIFIPRPLTKWAPTSYMFRDATIDLVYLAAAIRLYEFDHGKLPEKLEDLEGKSIDKIPMDPFNAGNIYKYFKENGGCVLYSVGPDGIDQKAKEKIDVSDTRNHNIRFDKSLKGDIVFEYKSIK